MGGNNNTCLVFGGVFRLIARKLIYLAIRAVRKACHAITSAIKGIRQPQSVACIEGIALSYQKQIGSGRLFGGG